MKTVKNLYSQLNKEKIKEIILKSARGKTRRREVRVVIENIDYYTEIVASMIRNKSYYMKPTHNRTICEKGKKRELTISPFFPNRILDYIVVELAKPAIRKSMYEYCIGNVDKRGMMFGKDVIAKKRNKYRYWLKLDIAHFYPSLSSEKLMGWIKKKIKDKDYIELAETVILSEDCLPIGSYYSQWFSNWFLQELDHLIKEKWGVEFYIRYVDDMLLMSNNKRKLLRTMYLINGWLEEKGLSLKRYEQAYTIEERPIDFLGFKFYKEKIVLRTRNFHKMNVRLGKIRKHNHICVSQARCILAYSGWLKQTNLGYLYYKNHIKPICKLGEMKRIISIYDKKVKERNAITTT